MKEVRGLLVLALMILLPPLGGCPDTSPASSGGDVSVDAADTTAKADATLDSAAPADATADTGTPAPDGVGDTADTTTPTDTGTVDVPPAEDTGTPIADVVADAADTTVDTQTPDVPASPDAGCQPVDCALACEHGFAVDASGCEMCACRQCEVAADCATAITCVDATCTEDGRCECGCSATSDHETYECASTGAKVPWCTCTKAFGVTCIDHPETLCPESCVPGTTLDVPCPDGGAGGTCECKPNEGCTPLCELGADGEGWYDPCTTKLIKEADCLDKDLPYGHVTTCKAWCGAVGSKSEGWFDGCGGGLITWDTCAPRMECPDPPEDGCNTKECVPGAAASYTCPGGTTLPWCTCDTGGGVECVPTCSHEGTADEGWYDPCTTELVKLGKCQGCTAKCDAIGSKSEGWYSSCDGLIQWANCGTAPAGGWTCSQAPWTGCTEPAACIGAGESVTPIGPEEPACCPGLAPIDYALETQDPQGNWECQYVDCLCYVCAACGDGSCGEGENHCNCPVDCPVGG